MLISIVVPIYNEADGNGLLNFITRLDSVTIKMEDYSWEYIFVDDGSIDGSLQILLTYIESKSHAKVHVIKLSRNFGHQAALIAGLRKSTGEYVISIDADLQDPPEIIPQMLTAAKNGIEVVIGKRSVRNGETFFKIASAKLFYKTLRFLSGNKYEDYEGDFRLLSRLALTELLNSIDKTPYIRGMVAWISLPTEIVFYKREARFAGKTHYSLNKMIGLALDAITGFSIKPLRISFIVGFVTAIFAACTSIYVIFSKLFFPSSSSQGWASITILLLIGFSIQFIILGILGEYLGKIVMNAQARPIYVIGEKHSNETSN